MTTFRCDHRDCREPASVFFLSQQNFKYKVCELHSSIPRLRRDLRIEINAFDFVQSAEDLDLYRTRRELAAKGLENLACLQDRCEQNLRKAMGRVKEVETAVCAAVVGICSEKQLEIRLRSEDIQRNFHQMRSHLEKLTTDKDLELTPAELNLCTEQRPAPLFVLGVRDCRLEVIKAVMESCTLLPLEGSALPIESLNNCAMMEMKSLGQFRAGNGQWDIAGEMFDYAHALGAEVTNYQPILQRFKHRSAKELLRVLPNTTPEDEIQAVVSEWLVAGVQAIQTGNYVKAENKLVKCKVLLQKRNFESPELSLHLAIVLAHSAKRTEAKAELISALESPKLDRNSELAVQLSTAQAEIHFQSGQWSATVTVCEWILNYWGNSRHTFELLRTLFYLITAHYWLGDYEIGRTLARKWLAKLSDPSPQCQCLIHLIKAETCWKECAVIMSKVPELFHQGLNLCAQYMPNAYFTAYCRRRLGFVYKSLKKYRLAEVEYPKACEIYSVHYPLSIDYAICLNCVAGLHDSMGKMEIAEKEYSQAYELFKSQFPNTQNFAHSLEDIGTFCKKQGKTATTTMLIEEALQIYAENGNDKKVKNCGSILAKYYNKLSQWCAQSQDLAMLQYWTGLLERLGRTEEAIWAVEERLSLYAKDYKLVQLLLCLFQLKRLRSVFEVG